VSGRQARHHGGRFLLLHDWPRAPECRRARDARARRIRHNPHPHAHVRPASPTHAHDAAVPAYGYLENSNL